MYDNSGFETVRRWYRHASVRRLELVGLGSTTIAFALTVWLAGSAYAVESNPFARELLATLGWVGAGSLALLLEGVIFEVYRRLERRAPRAARAGAGLVASIGVVDVLVNVWVLSRVGVPPELSNRLLGAVAIVTLVAVGVAAREVLLEPVRYQHEHAGPALRTAALVTITLSLAISGLAPFVGPLAFSDNVSASSHLIDDFEDGDISGWSGDTGFYSASQETAYLGDYSLKGEDNAGSPANLNEDIPAKKYENISYSLNTSDRSSLYPNMALQTGGGGTTVIKTAVDDDSGSYTGNPGHLMAYDGTSWVSIGAKVKKNTWYRIRYEAIDYTNDQTRIAIYAKNGTELGSQTVSFQSSASNIDRIAIASPNSGYAYTDHYSKNNTLISVQVDSGGSSGYSQTFGLDDRTGKFPTDRSTISVYTYEPGAKEISPASDSFELSETKNFNYAGNATFSLESGDLYKITVDSAGNSWELVGYTANDSDTYDELTIDTEIDLTEPTPTPTPDPDATPTPTLAPGETPAPTSTPLPTEGPVYLGECSEPGMTTGISVEYWDPNYETTSFEYAIENDSGVLFSGTKSFDEPIGYYRGCVGSELTNVTDPEDGNTTVDYNGTKDDGTEFSGSINWPDTFSGSSGGGFGGPVDSGADSPAATWLGWLLLAGGGYVAYRRFGNGELESTIASAGSSAGSAARSVGSTARRLFGRGR